MPKELARHLNLFRFSLGAVFVALAIGWMIGGPKLALLVAILAVLEISLSFENSVINATVLRRMSDFWQEMFLTVGLVIAVFGMRFVFPIVIVAVTAGLSFGKVFDLAIHHPEQYAHYLEIAHPAIAAFGGVFLFMVFLDFFLDAGRKVHWIDAVERPLARAGQLKTLPVLIALTLLMVIVYNIPTADQMRVMSAGVVGVLTYLGIHNLSRIFESLGNVDTTHPQDPHKLVRVTGKAAFSLFLYLEILDASFSFDGVVGAFAITGNVIVIALGLGVGAMFIRELTVWLVRHDTLTRVKYLEHGAYYAVGSLAVMLGLSLFLKLPEAVTGLTGAIIIGASVFTSWLEGRADSQAKAAPKP